MELPQQQRPLVRGVLRVGLLLVLLVGVLVRVLLALPHPLLLLLLPRSQQTQPPQHTRPPREGHLRWGEARDGGLFVLPPQYASVAPRDPFYEGLTY
jgi:hypothetical protein